MAPPLDRGDLYEARKWQSRRNTTTLRLPRRTRRNTYICLLLIASVFYISLHTLTSWSLYLPESVVNPFDHKHAVIPISFPNLYATVSKVSGTGGSRKVNRNVLFAAANLQAASKLAGMACEMAEFNRVRVHFAMMGFDNLDIDEFRRINGLPGEDDDGGCELHFHDARAELAEQLPMERKRVAIKSAFRHLHDFMHPQAVFVDSEDEEEFFVEIAKEKTDQMGMTLIALPKEGAEDWKWVTRLDSGSLRAWHKPRFEVVIHADSHSGNLERLLKSLQKAKYPTDKHEPSRITVILDSSQPVHPFLKDFLEGYVFPSRSRFTLRRPLAPASSPADAGSRFIESFYPRDGHTSVLMLDANTQLSPWYAHYLYYAMLAYRYSSYDHVDAKLLYGISLEDPPRALDGTPFTAAAEGSPFLYSAPTSRASLFFPQQWQEFHSFAMHKLRPSAHAGHKNSTFHPKPLVLAADLTHSWRSTLSELVRARGYVMLYPNYDTEVLAVVHNEVPSHTRRKHGVEKQIMWRNNVLSGLPEGELPSWGDMDVFDVSGRLLPWTAMDTLAMQYRLSVSTCPDSAQEVLFHVDDLFCDVDGEAVVM